MHAVLVAEGYEAALFGVLANQPPVNDGVVFIVYRSQSVL